MDDFFDIKKLDYYISKNVFTMKQTPERKVKNYEIELYTTSGNTSMVNGKKYRQTAGNILTAKPNDLRYSIDMFECYCIHFTCNNEKTAKIISALPTVTHCSDTEKFIQIFKNMMEARKLDNISSKFIICGALTELIGYLYAQRSNEYTGKFSQYVSEVSSSCMYMQKNIEKHITLKDISAYVNLSPVFFHTVFKTIKGVTPAEYLLNTRIVLAKKMLRLNNNPLSEIAVLCGFGSQGYFNYVFKKQTGTTPKKYRDKKQIII